MSFAALTHPDRPETQTIEHQFGVLVGWYPAIVTKIEDGTIDPEGLGRVRLRCDLISQLSDLPNEFDGWAWVLEEFVNNGKPGGAHRFIQPGAQVAISFMRGDPRFALLLGCLHSREDRPNPLFNRAQGVYGTASPNGVYSIKDDAKTSRTDAYPSGVTQQVSPTGDVIQQTRDGARVHLQADGTTRMENDKAATTVAADGSISQRSAGDAVAVLGSDGTAQIRTPFQGSLQLLETTARMTGTAAPFSALLRLANKNLGGFLGKAKSLLGTAAKVAIAMQTGGGLEAVLSGQGLLNQIAQGLGGNLTQGLQALQSMQSLPIEHFRRALQPQIDTALSTDLHALIPQIEAAVKSGAPTDLAAILPPEAISKIQPILNRLTQPDLQIEMIADAILPEGFNSIENLAITGLWDKLGKIQEIAIELPEIKLDNLISSYTVTQLNEETSGAGAQAEILDARAMEWATDRAQRIREVLPADFQSLIPVEDIAGILLEIDAGAQSVNDLFQDLMAKSLSERIAGAIDGLSGVSALAQAPGAILKLMNSAIEQTDFNGALQAALPALEGLLPGELRDTPSALIGQLTERLLSQLEKPLSQAIDQVKRLQELAPIGLPGAIVTADAVRAELRSLHGTHRVFADEGGVGAESPDSKFSFGGGGGLFQTLGQMAFQTLGKSPAGLALSAAKGIQLQTFLDAEGTQIASQIQAIGNAITITSGNGNGIAVSPGGTEIDGILVTELIRRIGSLESEVLQLRALIESLIPPTPPA